MQNHQSLAQGKTSKSEETFSKHRAKLKKRSKATKTDAGSGIQKNADFLKNHLNIFKSYNLDTIDSDTLFKKSLRSYNLPVSGNKFKWLENNKSSVNSRTELSTSSEVKFEETKSSDKLTSQSSTISFIDIMDPEAMGQEEGEDFFGSPKNEDTELFKELMDDINAAVEDAEESGFELSQPPAGGDKRESKTPDTTKKGTTLSPTLGKIPPGVDRDEWILKKIEEVEAEAIETSKQIHEIKERIEELMTKEQMTSAENDELNEKNLQLSELMKQFDDLTKLIEQLMKEAEAMKSDEYGDAQGKDQQKKMPEEALPKVVICGMTENNMPKIIICEAERSKREKKSSSGPESGTGKRGSCDIYCKPGKPLDSPARRDQKSSITLPSPAHIVPQFAKRLCDSYCMQEKLAAENADLEGKRYQLQEDLLNKDQTVESLQRKLCGLQAEMRIVLKENNELNKNLHQKEEKKRSKSKSKMSCSKRTFCPADVENRLLEYSNTTQLLEQQMGQMEAEMKNMQNELLGVQKERQQLRMKCAPQPKGPCAPKPCEQTLRDLREQYNRLQDDFKAKLTEVAGLRADVDRWKSAATLAEEAKKTLEDKLKDVDKSMKNVRQEKDRLMGSKELLIEQEQQLSVAKQRFREAQDELEELRALIQDQAAQLDDYRNKYLQAQQQVDEQRRQIDLMELENSRMAEQVNMEISRVKNHFQEKLQELMPLPDIVKATQLKLQEAQQMHILAERNNETMMREVHTQREKVQMLQAQLDKYMDEASSTDNQGLKAEELERRLAELHQENEQLKTDLARMEEVADQNEKRVQEKMHEIAQLVAQLDMVREESARQVARTKDRCETVRRSMQNQISDLERQLAQSRAAACSAQKERDDIRQKMQMQINNLNDNFEEAQLRIRNLQGHVNYLKNSYTNIFPNGGEPMGASAVGGPGLQLPDEADTCTCNGNNY